MTVWVLACVLAAASLQPPQAPRRDTAASTPSGTAVVSGMVTTDAEKPVPLRRARVVLSNPDIRYSRTIVTDDTGRFMFRNVPAGRFNLSAVKEAFVNAAYGARRPGGPGAPLTIADGGEITNLVLKLQRGGVITGVIADAAGQPVPDAQVAAFQYSFVNGERRLVSRQSGRSDDRGTYRLFGLSAGQYIVSASMPRMSFGATSDLLLPSDADVDRALQEPATGSQPMGVGRPAGYVPVYHPAATSIAQASQVEVAAGTERSGIDIQLLMVPTGRVEGTVTYPDGELPRNIQLSMTAAGDDGLRGLDGFRSGRPEANGRFQFGGLAPADYLVTARANLPGGGPDAVLWATASVAVTGDGTVQVPLELRRGFTVTGRVHFDGTKAPPVDMRGWRIGLGPVLGRNEISLGVNAAEVQPDGTFTVTGVPSGRFRVQPMTPSPLADEWQPRSIAADGRNLLDEPLEVHSDIQGMTVVYTDRIPTLSGRLQELAGAELPDYYVILFPADRALWVPQSPRIQAVRAGTDSRFTFKRVLPGSYLLAATLDVEPGEWMDPSFLQRLSPAAIPVLLVEGEPKVQDLRVAR